MKTSILAFLAFSLQLSASYAQQQMQQQADTITAQVAMVYPPPECDKRSHRGFACYSVHYATHSVFALRHDICRASTAEWVAQGSDNLRYKHKYVNL